MEKLKNQLTKRLFRHLEDKLEPTTMARVSTQDRLEILRCVVDWVYKDKEVLDKVSKAKRIEAAMKSKHKAPTGTKYRELTEKPDESDSLFSSPEFMEELEKL